MGADRTAKPRSHDEGPGPDETHGSADAKGCGPGPHRYSSRPSGQEDRSHEARATPPGTRVRGLAPEGVATVVSVEWSGDHALNVVYRTADGTLGEHLLFRDDEPCLALVEAGCPWSFDSDGELVRLVSEAHRIRLAWLFDPCGAPPKTGPERIIVSGPLGGGHRARQETPTRADHPRAA